VHFRHLSEFSNRRVVDRVLHRIQQLTSTQILTNGAQNAALLGDYCFVPGSEEKLFPDQQFVEYAREAGDFLAHCLEFDLSFTNVSARQLDIPSSLWPNAHLVRSQYAVPLQASICAKHSWCVLACGPCCLTVLLCLKSDVLDSI
jgi:hypothetical protein